MLLEIHSKAADSLNGKMNSLLTELTVKPRKESAQLRSIIPDIHSEPIPADAIIGDIRHGLSDIRGNEVAKYFIHESKEIGLFGEAYKNLTRIAEQFQKIPSFKYSVSVSFLLDTLFDWIKGKYFNTIKSACTEYVIRECEKAIVHMEIWIPIAETRVIGELKLGGIVIKNITKAMILGHIDSIVKKVREEVSAQETSRLRDRLFVKYKNLSGLAAATIIVEAEHNRAVEIAYEQADIALSMIRFLSVANLISGILSNTVLLGQERLERKEFFRVDGNTILGISEQISKSHQWILDAAQIMTQFRSEFTSINDLITNAKRNQFEESLFNALLLYSKSSLTKSSSDKLIYIFAALESVLLKNASEPIMQNISERIAALVGQSGPDRKDIIEIIKDIYGHRSSYVHHGSSIDQNEKLEKFLRIVWETFHKLLINKDSFSNKEQLHSYIDTMRLNY
jgi:hypothetical protein